MIENKENTGFAAFALYNALKLHFTSSSYDYIKYHGKTNVSKDTFLRRKDKYSFYRLSRKYSLDELRDFYIANFIYGDSTWVGEMTGPNGEEVYKKWQKINQSLTYRFESDIVRIMEQADKPDDLIKVPLDGHPPLLMGAMQNDIYIETLVILNDIMKFFPLWDKKISEDIIWPSWKLKCEKYTPFVIYDKVKFKNILKEIVTENA
jgi:hypothetical protein